MILSENSSYYFNLVFFVLSVFSEHKQNRNQTCSSYFLELILFLRRVTKLALNISISILDL